MPSICFYFQVHQPVRLNKFNIFNVNTPYFDLNNNKKIIKKVAKNCYLPANEIISSLIDDLGNEFKVAFSITGVFIDQCVKFSPETIESFKNLSSNRNVEFLSETFYHSLSSLFSTKEFEKQINMHKELIYNVFKKNTKVLRNTEAIYSNKIAKIAEQLGFKGIIAEGHEKILGSNSPNFLYTPKDCKKISTLFRNYKFSDDISFRFSNRLWRNYPLSANKYASWLSSCTGDCVNIFLDYETFGEHQRKSSGIFDFLKDLPYEILKYSNLNFKAPSELIDYYSSKGITDVSKVVSWADSQRDDSAWLGNNIQKYAFKQMTKLERLFKDNFNLLNIWRNLQTSDHFYYMSTKDYEDGEVHKYFNPYNSPYDAFINYMNVLFDLRKNLIKEKSYQNKKN